MSLTSLTCDKHVMLSYQWDSQALVTDVYRCLHAHNIRLWMDTQGGMKGHLSTSMAEGVENAVILYCFLTPQYQDSVACKDALTYAKERRVRIIPTRSMKDWKPTGWLGFSITGLKYINFCDITNMDLKINQLIAEIQMVAGEKLSSIQIINRNEEEKKQNEESANASADQGIEILKQYFDANSYYRFTTQWQGDDTSLDVVNDGKDNNRLILAKIGDCSGQYWKMTLVEDGYYRLTTQWQGDSKSLAIVKDGKSNDQLILDKTRGDSGQYWKITLLKNSYYRLASKWQGDDIFLDVLNDGQNNKIKLAKTGDFSGQSSLAPPPCHPLDGAMMLI